MISFATELPIDRSNDCDAFLRAIKRWILGSPHTRLVENQLSGLEGSDDFRVDYENETLVVLRCSTVEDQSVGVRYTKHNSGLEWVTTSVFSKGPLDTWISIKVSCESWNPALRLPRAKKPILIRTLLQTMGGANDGVLNVDGQPRYLDNTEIEIAAKLIAGHSGCRLPIVYVSAGFLGSYLVDPARLASELEGMAHVVVEPNRPFSLRLKIEVDAENVYGGNVGIYWPDGGGRRSFFIGNEYESGRDIESAIFEEICRSLTNRRSLDRCTWAYVQERVSRNAIRALQASGSSEVEKYIETFDKELEAKSQRLIDANHEISRLQTELQSYQSRMKVATGSWLQSGGEQDLYENEVFVIVRQAIEEASKRVPNDSRRMHVLTAVLNATPQVEDNTLVKGQRIKELLRGYRGMDSKTKRGLEEIGFSITAEGKHFKLVFQGDERYTFTLPKSGSDRRGGLNAGAKIASLLF